jgi:hypothetical protein
MSRIVNRKSQRNSGFVFCMSRVWISETRQTALGDDLLFCIVSIKVNSGIKYGTIAFSHSLLITLYVRNKCECVSKSFRTGRLERELQMVQISATRCSCIAILWVSSVNFAAIMLCVASQRVFVVVRVYFFIYSVRKLLDTHSYVTAFSVWWPF